MTTDFFYLALTPTVNGAPFYYSVIFSITYIDNNNLTDQQNDYVINFRGFVGNPINYNPQWSKGYNDAASADVDRSGEITSLTNAGQIINTPNWP